MRNLFLSTLLVVLTFSLSSFGNADNKTLNLETDVKTEALDDNINVKYNTIVDEYDICTITVTVKTKCGSYSATASNNQGDCAAAEAAALAHAMMLAGVFCDL